MDDRNIRCERALKDTANSYAFSWMTNNYKPNKNCDDIIQTSIIRPGGELIDLENELIGKNTILTKGCFLSNSIPDLKQKCSCEKCKNNTKQTSQFLTPEYTRVSLPCNIKVPSYKPMPDYNEPLLNSYFLNGINTRQQAKDNFKKM